MKAWHFLVAAFLLGISPAPAEVDAARLQALVREHAAGMKFERIDSADGRTYRGVVITAATAERVDFDHEGGSASLEASRWPALWRDLFGTPSPAAVTDSAAAAAIAVIAGDRSNGTGFFCRDGEKIYLYSAAHVLSGNSRLQVKLRDGSVVRKFGPLEAAEGADLVRLPVLESVPHALAIAPSGGAAKVGDPVMASGNAGGGGTVGFERGKILGVGSESIEIDADVIQGNSGGPIIHGGTKQALGVVTHLTAERKDLWAKDTRFAGVRRFGCRLDRDWQWKVVPVEVFLREGRAILAVQDQSELMVAALQPEKWSDPVFQRLRESPLARDVAALEAWINQQRSGGQRLSETDRKKRLRTVFDSARHRSRGQMAELKSEGFTWFHRQTAEQEIQTRTEIEKAYEDAVSGLR
jgi:hypothetical protein